MRRQEIFILGQCKTHFLEGTLYVAAPAQADRL